VIAVSHAVLCGPAVERLDGAPIDALLVIDTIPQRDPGPKNLKVMSVAPLLASAIKSIHTSSSISSLFE
jgi:ribose-phosphate pyrophosphokinase